MDGPPGTGGGCKPKLVSLRPEEALGCPRKLANG